LCYNIIILFIINSMNMKNIISCGININIFIISNNIIITMRSDLTALAPRDACYVAPRDVRAVIVNLVFCHDSSIKWRWDLLRALSRPSATWWCWGRGATPPPEALEVLWLGMECLYIKYLCLGLQHIISPQIMQSTVQ